jgi:hypothetical protein
VLAAEGSEIGLYAQDGAMADALQLAPQAKDWSAARMPDGAGDWAVTRDPTPGAPNSDTRVETCALRDAPEVDAPGVEGVPGAADPSCELFAVTEFPELVIEVSSDAADSLRIDPYTYVEGTIAYRGRVFGPVAVRLKGQNSFLRFDQKPSFKVDLNRYVAGGALLELKKLTFNNMSSDPTMVRERLAYAMYREADLPAPRCNHARLHVNGSYYGVYANVESVDDFLLARWFDDPTGSLFEGTDVDFYTGHIDSFELENGPDVRDRLMALALALRIDPPAAAWAEVGAHVDVAHWQLFWAVTAAVGQFDGYPYHVDDYRVYDDPISQQLWFIPWGTDESFVPSLTINDVDGLMGSQCAAVPACRDAWGTRLVAVVDLMEDHDLLGMMDTIAAQIQPALEQDIRKPYIDVEISAARAALRAFVTDRKQTVLDEL